ncbi:MAG TPA: ABC transporter permease [Candidatus Polarisedimenticolia bacterium]|nr:ABC transporter permease [Candidatus Polarisedimenticolia bacterium]
MTGGATRALEQVGAFSILIARSARETVRRRPEGSVVLDQLYQLGVLSVGIATVTAMFTGMVLALQTSYSLAVYGAKFFVGDIVALSLVRELGPVLTSLMVGGRVGAGITAEIGTMNVTEQIDAIRAMAASPVRKLVVPKVIAIVIMLPVLVVLSDFVGILGGLLMAVTTLNQPAAFYMQHVIKAIHPEDILSGLGKTVVFALLIGFIACYKGLTATGGADGVGRATTETVVASSLSILISDFFLTKLFLAF